MVWARTYRERDVCVERPQIVLMPGILVQIIPTILRRATVWGIHKAWDLTVFYRPL